MQESQQKRNPEATKSGQEAARASEVVPLPGTRRNLYAFGVTSFLNDTASEMAYWIIPAFLTSLGAGPGTLGVIEGIAESVASLAKLYSGYLTDRVPRRKPLVVAGYAVANAMKPLLALATAWWHVLLIRFADRVSKGVRGAPRDVMLSESVPKGKLGGAFGLLQSMDTAGAIAGPLLALLILRYFGFGYRTVFWIAAVPGLLSVLVVWLTVRETADPSRRSESTNPSLSSGVRLPAQAPATRLDLPASFYYVLTAVTLFSLGNSSDMFLVLRAQNVGIPASAAPLLGLVFNITYTAVSWPAGRLSDRMSKRVMAALGYMVFAVVYVVFATAPSYAAIWAVMASYGLYYSLTDPVLRALVAQTVRPEARGRAFGIFYFVTSIATLLASIIAGQLWNHFGPQLPFYVSAGLATIAAAMLLKPVSKTSF
jgi:MFS family permease